MRQKGHLRKKSNIKELTEEIPYHTKNCKRKRLNQNFPLKNSIFTEKFCEILLLSFSGIKKKRSEDKKNAPF